MSETAEEALKLPFVADDAGIWFRYQYVTVNLKYTSVKHPNGFQACSMVEVMCWSNETDIKGQDMVLEYFPGSCDGNPLPFATLAQATAILGWASSLMAPVPAKRYGN